MLRWEVLGMARILYVEDNDDNIYMLKQRLERKGFEVLVARDGRAGVEAAREHMPDLILLDLGLPVLDGWEAARLLKQDERTQAIPIIALSAHAMAGDRAAALEAGCNDYGTKPVDFRQLLEKMAALLPSPGACP
jgi:two-component system, cell cycle response regulator DivK